MNQEIKKKPGRPPKDPLAKLREAVAKIPDLPAWANQDDRDGVLKAVVEALRKGVL